MLLALRELTNGKLNTNRVPQGLMRREKSCVTWSKQLTGPLDLNTPRNFVSFVALTSQARDVGCRGFSGNTVWLQGAEPGFMEVDITGRKSFMFSCNVMSDSATP